MARKVSIHMPCYKLFIETGVVLILPLMVRTIDKSELDNGCILVGPKQFSLSTLSNR